MIVYIQLHQDIQHIITLQAIDIGCQDIMITTTPHHILIIAHFTLIHYIQDPTIHHITGEIIMLTLTCIIVHISQDILQLEACHIMILFTEDQAPIGIITPAHHGLHIIHHLLIEVTYLIKNFH